MTAVSKSISSQQALFGGILFATLFTGLIWFLGTQYAQQVVLHPDKPGFWYYWQLLEPTVWTRASAWLGYGAHQILIWILIYTAQSQRLAYSGTLHRVNVLALAVSATFITLHLVQTRIWYDGLAQDVSEWSSQWSVILVLVMVLLMENQRRGLVFGKKVPFLGDATRVIRKYHGYYFSWAIIYTFWYHPMLATSGHLLGFLYMFLLLLQGSLFFTRMHVNKYWTFVQEAAVVVHAVLVAIMNSDGGAPMFLFGFAGVFVVTQMHGLGLSGWLRWLFLSLYVGGVSVVYYERGLTRLEEIIRVPAAEYLSVIVLALLLIGAMRVVRWTRKSTAHG